MRTFISILLVIIGLTAFGQRNVKKAYILIDGKETSYKEYKKIDPTNFAEIHVLPGKDEIVRLFGKKAKKGIVHLKTSKFIDNQKKLLQDLMMEFESSKVETTLIVINGVPYDRTQFQMDKMSKLTYETVEWIAIPEDTGILNHKRVIVIQTNVEI